MINRLFACCWMVLGPAGAAAQSLVDIPEPDRRGLVTVEGLGLRLQRGFRIRLVSDHEVANDIYAMTLDAKGRIVVTSRGWIRTLHDDDGDGKMDRAVEFAETRSGGMGMCFDGSDLLFSGDGGLWRYRDRDGDGKADGKRERVFRLRHGEHGIHAIRRGPDGFWYIMGGNDARIGSEHVTINASPIREPQTGGIVRATPDLKKFEVIAHGFRNPYDFDFNPAGDLFCYDSDCERDFFLPWYTPTRLYHVGVGLHHGWRLRGYKRSFSRKDYYPDVVDILWSAGRGSPTGVACYRHTQFPEPYRGGVFYCDWTFGRVYFTALEPRGAGYKSQAAVFLEPVGTVGFAPNDVEVAPDGSLLVSIGGRRTRGAVYRIEWEGGTADPEPESDLDKVLRAPQPLEAWSRARWMPWARALGKEAFVKAVLDEKRSASERVRAVEILTEIFKSLDREILDASRKIDEPRVRARLAWSIGRLGGDSALDYLGVLTGDADARVRTRALEASIDLRNGLSDSHTVGHVIGNLDHPDKRVRQAAAKLASRLFGDWIEGHLLKVARKENTQSLLTTSMALLWRRKGGLDTALDLSVESLGGSEDPALRLQAVRLIVRALGDSNLHDPPIEVHSNYSLPEAPPAELRTRILKMLRPIYPSGDRHLDAEAARLLAMLEDEDPETIRKTAAFITEESSPTWDMHYLIVLSRLRGAHPEGLAKKIAHAMLSLSRKLRGAEQRTNQTWGFRVAELQTVFARKNPAVVEELLTHPEFVRPGHVGLAASMTDDFRRRAARLFLERVKEDPEFVWSEGLLRLLGELPAEESHPVFRSQWPNFALRDSIVRHLARSPAESDREKFLSEIDSSNPAAFRASLFALEKLPRDPSPANLVPLLRLLRRLTLEPKQSEPRKGIVALIVRQTGRAFVGREEKTSPSALRAAYRPLFDRFLKEYPDRRTELEGSGGGAVDVKTLLRGVDWSAGDSGRGREVFRKRGCQTCHATSGALGPNLAGAASRFNREDLFQSIANPNRDVAPLYRTRVFRLKNGETVTGIVAFQSADGYILQTGATTTIRINTANVAAVRPGTLSIMPNGLLKGLKPRELADLDAYLRSLK